MTDQPSVIDVQPLTCGDLSAVTGHRLGAESLGPPPHWYDAPRHPEQAGADARDRCSGSGASVRRVRPGDTILVIGRVSSNERELTACCDVECNGVQLFWYLLVDSVHGSCDSGS